MTNDGMTAKRGCGRKTRITGRRSDGVMGPRTRKTRIARILTNGDGAALTLCPRVEGVSLCVHIEFVRLAR